MQSICAPPLTCQVDLNGHAAGLRAESRHLRARRRSRGRAIDDGAYAPASDNIGSDAASSSRVAAIGVEAERQTTPRRGVGRGAQRVLTRRRAKGRKARQICRGRLFQSEVGELCLGYAERPLAQFRGLCVKGRRRALVNFLFGT